MLDNKLGINSSTDLALVEERISKKKAVMLFDEHIIHNIKCGRFSTLQVIHKYLFEDIYDFAGKVRTVNIAKGNFRFAPIIYIEESLKNIDQMPQSTFDEIIEKYVEMNVAHPFKEGNGRSPIKDIEIKYLLKNALTDEINSRDVYMKGIDHSYYYEGYITYKAKDL